MYQFAAPFSQRDITAMRFRRQWVLLKDKMPHDLQWQQRSVNDEYKLYCHNDCIVRSKKISQGIIYLLGIAISTAFPDKDPLELVTEYSHESIVSWLHGISGSYACIISNNNSIDIYTDPSATMGIYYTQDVVASCPGLIPGLTRDKIIDEQYILGKVDDWYPGSLTPFTGVKALMANHRLQLNDCSVERFWPGTEFKTYEKDEGIAVISELIKKTLYGASKIGKLLVSLTGGRDSRINLGATKDFREKVRYFTIKNDAVNPEDLRCAQLLADEVSLNYSVVPSDYPEDWLLDLYDEIGMGMSVGTRRVIIDAALAISGPDHIHVNGSQGALFNGDYWPSVDPKKFNGMILKKQFVSNAKCIVNAVQEWTDSVPKGIPPRAGYDLMYLEQRGGRWGGIGETSSSLFYAPLTPFNSREIFEIIQGLPAELVHSGFMTKDFVRILWPELLDVPYSIVGRSLGKHFPKWLKVLIKKILRK